MPGNTSTTGSAAVWYSTSDGPTYSFNGTNLKKEGDVGKKKRTKQAGKAAAKAKTEKSAKRKGGKGAR